jgi:hypothetical protein
MNFWNQSVLVFHFMYNCSLFITFTHFALVLTNCMDESPWEANRFSASRGRPCTLQNPKVHGHAYKHPPLVPVLRLDEFSSQSPSYLFTINFNSILPSTPGSSKWSLSFSFPHHNSVCNCLLPFTSHIFLSLHPWSKFEVHITFHRMLIFFMGRSCEPVVHVPHLTTTLCWFSVPPYSIFHFHTRKTFFYVQLWTVSETSVAYCTLGISQPEAWDLLQNLMQVTVEQYYVCILLWCLCYVSWANGTWQFIGVYYY